MAQAIEPATPLVALPRQPGSACSGRNRGGLHRGLDAVTRRRRFSTSCHAARQEPSAHDRAEAGDGQGTEHVSE